MLAEATEAFYNTNCVEEEAGKFRCPLSGKLLEKVRDTLESSLNALMRKTPTAVVQVWGFVVLLLGPSLFEPDRRPQHFLHLLDKLFAQVA